MHPNRIHSSVAPSDLLKALNALQNHHNYDEQLSFGHTPHRPPQNPMNFEIYMEKKVVNPLKQQAQSQKQTRKSVTPLKDLPRNTNNQYFQKPLSPCPQTRLNFDRGVDKENDRRNSGQKEGMSSSKLSYHTRKILNEKEKNGKGYVPIQLRAQELLKEREGKIAKLKKEKEVFEMLKDKECTFAPKISKPLYKASKPTQKHSRIPTTEATEVEPQSFWEGKSDLNDERSLQKTLKPQVQQPAGVPCSPMPTMKKYKNDKFNPLLDLLH